MISSRCKAMPIFLVGILAGIAAGLWRIKCIDQSDNLGALTARRLQPSPSATESTVTEQTPVIFAFQIRNAADFVLGPFQVQNLCSCDIEESLPSKLSPGQQSQFAFRVHPPPAGILTTAVHITDASGQPLLTLPVVVRNVAPVPRIEAVGSVRLDIVRGVEFVHDVQVACVERSDDAPLIAGVSTTSNVPFSVSIVGVGDDQIRSYAPHVRRLYHVRITGNAGSDVRPGPESGDVALLRGSGDEVARLPVSWRVREQLSFIPEQIVFREADDATDVSILYRGPDADRPLYVVPIVDDVEPPVEVVQIERERNATGPIVARFVVRAKHLLRSIDSCEIAFESRGNVPLRAVLPVRFLASSKASDRLDAKCDQ